MICYMIYYHINYMICYNINRKDDTMKELKLDGIVLKLNEVDKFQRIKDHIESCSEEEVSNTTVAQILLSSAMNNYKFE